MIGDDRCLRSPRIVVHFPNFGADQMSRMRTIRNETGNRSSQRIRSSLGLEPLRGRIDSILLTGLGGLDVLKNDTRILIYVSGSILLLCGLFLIFYHRFAPVQLPAQCSRRGQ